MKKLIHNNWMTILALSCLFLIFFCNYRYAYTICVLNDEFGYWGNAATMAGKDWSSLLAQTPYYSMGYSLFLVPLFKLGVHPVTMYKIAVLLNMGFLSASLLCADYITGRLFLENKRMLNQLIGIIGVMSGPALFYSQIGWCETCLMMLFLFLVVLFVKLGERFSYLVSFEIVVCSLMLYIVHQRTIAIMALAIVLLLFECIKNKKYVFLILVIVAVGLCVFGYRSLHSYQVSHVYSASAYSSTNNIELSSSFISGFMSRLFDYSEEIIVSFICKLGVVLISTCFTLFVSCKSYLLDLRNKTFGFISVKTFMLLSLLIMLSLSSIQMFGEARKDLVVYSRYLDFTIPGMTIYGLGVLLQQRGKHKKLYLLSIVLIIPVIILSAWRIDRAQGEFNTFCSPVWGAAYQLFGNQEILKAGIAIMIACFILFLLYWILPKTKMNSWMMFFLYSLCVLNLIVFGLGNERTKWYRDRIYNSVSSAFEIVSTDPE